MKVAVFLTLAVCAVLVSGLSEKWDEENNPASFDLNDNFVYNFSAIPASGALGEGVGWSDTYWPSYKSGIAHRWYSEDPQDYKYHLYTLEELKNLTIEELKTLSPGEKYDIFIGRYDYPIVHTEWKRTSAEDPTWEGICHGWAPASIFYKEPNPVTLTSKDGIEVPFGSSDVKALLSYYAGQYDRAETAFIGRRCNTDLYEHPEAQNSTECADLHAAAFFLILSNMISTEKTGFVVDRDRGDQVWNQPVTSYSFSFDESPTTFDEAANRTVDVTMVMTYVVETQPQWEAHPPYLTSTRYYFHLNLDKEGNIIGGDYYNFRSNRADFAWSSQISEFFGYFEELKEVYVASTNDSRPTFGEFIVTDAEQNAFENVMTQDGSFFYLEPYGANHRQAWSILAEEDVEEIEITFLWIDVTKYDDTIRIYEEADGTGALVSVLHGEYEEATTIRVKASGVFVLFKSSAFTDGRGFHATYRFITKSATI